MKTSTLRPKKQESTWGIVKPDIGKWGILIDPRDRRDATAHEARGFFKASEGRHLGLLWPD